MYIQKLYILHTVWQKNNIDNRNSESITENERRNLVEEGRVGIAGDGVESVQLREGSHHFASVGSVSVPDPAPLKVDGPQMFQRSEFVQVCPQLEVFVVVEPKVLQNFQMRDVLDPRHEVDWQVQECQFPLKYTCIFTISHCMPSPTSRTDIVFQPFDLGQSILRDVEFLEFRQGVQSLQFCHSVRLYT